MKIATWNVNSLRVRLPQLLQWMSDNTPDIMLLQETKLTDDKFPHNELAAAGYHAACHGQATYNGVAILSKTPLTDVCKNIPGRDDEQARVIAAVTGGIRAVSVYVPNGQSLDSDKFQYKLGWLKDFADYAAGMAGEDTVIGGDFNIAPTDADIYDPAAWGEGIHASPQERTALKHILNALPTISGGSPKERTALDNIIGRGYTDAHQLFQHKPDTFSWWDYRAGAFQKNQGLRIDLILTSASLTPRCLYCTPDITPRRWERPSDHTPIITEFA